MSWSTLNFREDLKQYEELLKKETDPIIREELLKCICLLKNEIVIEEITRYEREHAIEDFADIRKIGTIVQNLSDVSKYSFYYPYIYEFRDKLNEGLASKRLKFNRNSDLRLTEEEALSLTHDMFKSTDKEFLEMYEELVSDKDVFKFDDTMNTDDGSSFYYPFINKRYIEVGTNGNHEYILGTLAHEIGHYIGTKLNEDRFTNNESFNEIESLFIELIGLDYYREHLNDYYFRGIMSERLFEHYTGAKRILAMKEVADKSFETLNLQHNPYKYYASLAESNKDYEEIILPDSIRYVMGYISAVELFEIYKVDKRFAIDTFKKVIQKDDDKTEYEQIVENLSLNCNLDNHVKRLHLGR